MSKEETKVVKGVGILCMFFHHLFYKADIYAEFVFSGLIYDAEHTMMIASDMKVCVAIFSLLSGYGMAMKASQTELNYGNIGSKYYKGIIKSYLELIKDTFFLMIVVIPVSCIFELPRQPKTIWGGGLDNLVKGMLSNMFGIAGFIGINWFIRSWWYLKVAILFFLLFPIVFEISKFKYGKIGIVLSYVFIIIATDINLLRDNIWRYLPPFYFGIVMAEWGIFERIRMDIRGKVERIVIVATGCLVIFSVTCYLRRIVGAAFLTQAVGAVSISILSFVLLSQLPYVSSILEIIGNNSKYMWLIHVYIYGQVLREWLFSLHNIWSILVVLTIISLASSICLKKVNETMLQKLKKCLITITSRVAYNKNES